MNPLDTPRITDLETAYHDAIKTAETSYTDPEIDAAISSATDLLLELTEKRAGTIKEAAAKLDVALASLEIRCHDEPAYELLQSLLIDLRAMESTEEATRAAAAYR